MLATDSYLPLMTKEADEFMAEYNRTNVRMAGTTTREAIVALLNDSVRCICVDRSLNAEERKVVQDAKINLATVRIGRDALVFIVSDQNSLKTANLETLKLILEKSIVNWRNVPGSRTSGVLELITTGKNSGTQEMLQRRFFSLSKDMVPTMTGATEKEIVQYVAINPKALGIVSFATMVGHPKGAHMLAIETTDSTSQKRVVDPNQSTIYEELYPLHFSLYLYISEEKLSVGSGFSTFVMTLPGQQIIQDFGLAPEIVPSRIIQLKSE